MRNEDRIVRLSALAMGGEGRAVDSSDPFSLVRAACKDLVRTLPKDRRDTLVLLNADDIAGGVLEALLGFPRRDTGDGISELAEDILGWAKADGQLILAVCMSPPSLEAWERDEWAGSRRIKEKEFFVRLMENYHLAIVIGRLDATSADKQLALITASIRRYLDAARGPNHGGDWHSRRDDLHNDVKALYSRADVVFGHDLLVSHCGSESRESHGLFLQIVAQLDQFGKRPIEEIKKGIARDCESIKIFEHYIDGSYGLRQKLNRAIQQNDKEELGLVRYLQAYELFRDCARWLGDGAFPWARTWCSPQDESRNYANALQQDGVGARGAAKRPQAPFKALFIDENLGPACSLDETRRLRARLSDVFSLLFPEGRLELDLIDSADGVLPTPEEHAKIGDSIAAIDDFFENMLPRRTWRIDDWRLKSGRDAWEWNLSPVAEKRSLRDYQVIFCEVDYRTRFAGPQIVQKLASYLSGRQRLMIDRRCRH